MGSLKCVVNLPYITQLPRDVSQQTFCFITPDNDPERLSDICDALGTFYNRTDTVSEVHLGTFISPVVDRSLCWVDVYDVSSLPSGPPIYSKPIIIGSSGSTTSLPLEVALVQSFQGDKTGSMPQARRRGRNYLGPFNTLAIATVAGLPRPNEDLILTVQGAAQWLCSYVVEENIAQWCVWSRSSNLFVPITNGWINNEWDTQRRREADETDRTRWFINP